MKWRVLFQATGDGVYSAFFTTDGREFQIIGAVVNGNLQMYNVMFPNEKYGFNGRKLRLGINYVSYCIAIADRARRRAYNRYRSSLLHPS